MSFFLKMQQGMENGLPITCASCKFIQEGSWRCNRKDTCGGPHSGRDFPDYDGPLQRKLWYERCLVCGEGKPTHSMIVPDATTRFGLCSEHAKIFQKNFIPVGAQIIGRIIQPPVVIALSS